MMNRIKFAGLVLSGLLFTACRTTRQAPYEPPETEPEAAQAAAEPAQTRPEAAQAAPAQTRPAAAPAQAAAAAQTKPALAIDLDAAVRETSDYLNRQLPKGNKLVILNIQSDFPALSEYIIDELIANTVNDRFFSVVDRRQLDAIRAELDFQTSGEVDDETAQALGRIAGAQIIISGGVSRIGDLYRLRVRALSVQSAEIAGQFNRNIPTNATITALVNSRATGYGGGAHYGGAAAGASKPGPAQPVLPQGAPPAAAAQPQGAAAAAPAAASGTAAMTQAGLYAGAAFQGAMDLYGAIDWLAANAQTGGNYTIVLDKDQAVTPTEFSYPNKTVGVTLKCAGGRRKVTFEGKSPAYSLFTVRDGVTLTLEEGITLEGAQNDANKSLVHVAGGSLVLKGATLTGNKTTGNGGGVYVASGKLAMYNSTVSKNTAAGGYGGGVYVAASGGFTMEDSVISGNSSARGNGDCAGGGVYIASGTFTLNNSTIGGNSVSSSSSLNKSYGGGVWVKGAFTMNGGTISGNSVAADFSSVGGGGAYVEGTFTMNNGTISGNSSSSSYSYGGGGVWVKGTFTMNNGTISGNSSSSSYSGGGGAYVEGPFTMTGGTISGNSAKSGGGAYVTGRFIKSGGVIYGSNAQEAGQPNMAQDDSRGHAAALGNDRGSEISKKRNTTARAGAVMDSEKSGPAGGWE
ncbi:MAG: CsgG/HfaB family protein [Treponema sp.]|jgi:hypothetical protein|nr:CsgG/HfaB family protein [Treponema sp.]